MKPGTTPNVFLISSLSIGNCLHSIDHRLIRNQIVIIPTILDMSRYILLAVYCVFNLKPKHSRKNIYNFSLYAMQAYQNKADFRSSHQYGVIEETLNSEEISSTQEKHGGNVIFYSVQEISD